MIHIAQCLQILSKEILKLDHDHWLFGDVDILQLINFINTHKLFIFMKRSNNQSIQIYWI